LSQPRVLTEFEFTRKKPVTEVTGLF
jgi:hypothetical protein